jgi:hypothetical protein
MLEASARIGRNASKSVEIQGLRLCDRGHLGFGYPSPLHAYQVVAIFTRAPAPTQIKRSAELKRLRAFSVVLTSQHTP